MFAALNAVVFFLAFVARARPLLVLGGFLAIVLLVVLLLALFNVFPLEVERRRRRLRGRGPFFLPLTVSRPWGTSYALKVRCAGGEGDLPLVKGRQQVILPLTDPPSGEQEVLLVSSFPLGFFRVAKRLRGPVISLEPSRHREKTHDSVSELTEYDGRHPWSRLDWKALARFQRLLVRKTGEEEEEEVLPPPQRAFSVRKLHLPSPWPAVWAYVSAFLAAFPFLAEAPWWLTTGFLVGLAYGIWRVFSGQRAPLSENLGALAVFVIAVLSLPGLSWENLWGRLAGFVLAVILVKTLSPHREHDVLQILLLSFLLVLLRLIQGNCSVIWLLLVLLGGLLPGMYFWQLSSAGRGLRALGPLAVLLVSGGVSLLVFHYLPWSVPSSWSVTGLSPFFDLGDFAPLKRDHTLLGRLYPPETSGNTFRRVYLSAFVYTKYRRGHWSLAVLPLECKGRKEDFRLVLEEPLPALPYPGCPVEIRTPHGHWYPKRLPLAPAGPGEYR
ncbi:MAG: DUF3488 domain-containing protein, partial [Thermodesulfobacteria bacterium]|nr:DUF3488 domain-containing protein [Thermodesulfobacteriota bacterium]